MFTIRIDSEAALKYAEKLGRLSRSALPNAIRNALNSAAFDVKKNTMPQIARKEFVNRSPNFFKANSRVEMARGFDIRKMESKVGFVERGLKGDHNFSVKDLEQQEHGGDIKGKSFIPTKEARKSKSNKSLVRPVNRLTRINNIVNVKNASGANQGQKFIKSVIHAGKGGHVLDEKKGILWRVNSIARTKGGAFKLTPIYTFRDNRSVKVKPTGFMEWASRKSAGRLNNFFYIAAQKEMAKAR